jgi:integrase
MSAGHIRQRGRESWELKWDAGRDATGQRITKTKTVRGAKRDAQRELRRILDAVESGTFADPGKVTLGEWLDTWLAGRRHTIAPKTAERYAELIAKHLNPKIGHHALAKVTATILNGFYVDRLERGRLDGKGGLSPQTVRHMDRLLHRAFHDAIRRRLLATNPTDYVDRPKVNRKPKRTLDDDALAALMGKAAGGRLHAPLFIILATGARRGELLALRWRNVDLAASQAQIVETLEETKAGGLRFKDVKTAAGRRRVDLPASAVQVLRAHQLEQKKLHLALGLGWSTDTLVFPALEGEPWRPRNFTKAITAMATAAGVTGFSPHAGRHDHFTRLLKAGIHPKAAQVRAGHSSVTVTLDVYSHATDGLQQEAAERIDNVLKAFGEK